MIRSFSNTLILILCLSIIGCGGKNDPDPDQIVDDISYAEMLNMVPDSTELIESEKFYVLEKSVDDIKREIKILQAHVVEYGYQQSETDYSKKLKEFIDRPPPAHKISLKNGSIIEGTIKKDKQISLLVDTDVGKLIINKLDIEKIDDLILPSADIVFIGHGYEEVFKDYRIFSGKIINQGNRRGDFVRVIYNLWDKNTELIKSDSSFVGGPQIVYHSGIVTDTILEPNKSAQFNIEVFISDSINVAYVTRDIRWDLYD